MNVGRTDILILSLLIHEHGAFLLLFSSSLTSLITVGHFLPKMMLHVWLDLYSSFSFGGEGVLM
jgi:hypothetical protein